MHIVLEMVNGGARRAGATLLETAEEADKHILRLVREFYGGELDDGTYTEEQVAAKGAEAAKDARGEDGWKPIPGEMNGWVVHCFESWPRLGPTHASEDVG